MPDTMHAVEEQQDELREGLYFKRVVARPELYLVLGIDGDDVTLENVATTYTMRMDKLDVLELMATGEFAPVVY